MGGGRGERGLEPEEEAEAPEETVAIGGISLLDDKENRMIRSYELVVIFRIRT